MNKNTKPTECAPNAETRELSPDALDMVNGAGNAVGGAVAGVGDAAGDVVTGVGDAVDASCLELIIVPAVALDGNRNRLGRGKGFYDRLLNSTSCPTIGVVCGFQLVEEVPVEQHDRPLDCVVTSDGVIAEAIEFKG